MLHDTVLAAVAEFLTYHGCTAALEALHTATPAILESNGENQVDSEDLLKAFDAGTKAGFFALWEDATGGTDRSQSAFIRLDFFLHIYMYIFPFLHKRKLPSVEMQQHCKELKVIHTGVFGVGWCTCTCTCKFNNPDRTTTTAADICIQHLLFMNGFAPQFPALEKHGELGRECQLGRGQVTCIRLQRGRVRFETLEQ